MKRHRSGSCSCTNCAYKSQSNRPSVQQLLDDGTRVDKLFYGKYLPLRERKLLEKLVSTRAVYDDVRNQLLSSSESSGRTRSEYILKNEIDDIAARNSAILKMVDLVDRGQIKSSNTSRLSSCCNCCSCSSLKKIKKSSEKHHHVHKHSVPSENIDKYRRRAEKRARSKRKRLGSKISTKMRRVSMNVKNIRSAPMCMCTLSISSVKKTSKALMKKLKSKERATNAIEQPKSFAEKEGPKPKKKPPAKGKTKGTESENKISRRFRVRKDSISLYRERLKKKELMNEWACEPGFCTPDECDPQECYEYLKSKRRKNKLHHKLSGTHTDKSDVAIMARPTKGEKPLKDVKTKSIPKCECVPVTETSISRFKSSATQKKLKPTKIKKQKKKLPKTTSKENQADYFGEVASHVTTMSRPKKEGKSVKDVKVKSTVKCECVISTGTTTELKEKSYHKSKKNKSSFKKATKHTSSQSDLSHKEKNEKSSQLDLKRCFCTLTLQKMKQKMKKSISKKTMTSLSVHDSEKTGHMRQTQTKSSDISNIGRHMKAQQRLLPYECEPFFCTPGECDPYECLKRIKVRDRKERSPEKSTSSFISQDKKSIREENTQSARKKKETKSKNSQGIKVHKPRVHDSSTQISKAKKTKRTDTVPFLHKCLCFFNKKTTTSGNKSDINSKMRNKATKHDTETKHLHDHAKPIAQDTKQHKKTESPKRHVSLETRKFAHSMKHHNKILGTSTATRSAYSESPKRKRSLESRRSQTYTREKHKTKKRERHYKESQHYDISPKQSSRQAVRIGSSFSFNIEFYKERKQADDVNKSRETNRSKRVIQNQFRDKSIKKHEMTKLAKDKVKAKDSQQFKHGSDYRTITTGTKSKEKSIYGGTAMKACYCTLKFQKKGKNTKIEEKNIFSNKSTKTNIQDLGPKFTAESKSTSTNRNFKRDRQNSTQKRKRKSIVTMTSAEYSSSLRSRGTQSIDSEYGRKMQAALSLTNSSSRSRQTVRIGSDFSFSIDFYKDRSMSRTGQDNFVPQKHKTYSDLKSAGKKRHKATKDKERLPKYRQAQENNVKNKDSNLDHLLKRCLCRLKLQEMEDMEKQNFKKKRPITAQFMHILQKTPFNQTDREFTKISQISIENKYMKSFEQLEDSDNFEVDSSNISRQDLQNNCNAFSRYDSKISIKTQTQIQTRNISKQNSQTISDIDFDMEFDEKCNNIKGATSTLYQYNEYQLKYLLNNSQTQNNRSPFFRSYYALNVKVSQGFKPSKQIATDTTQVRATKTGTSDNFRRPKAVTQIKSSVNMNVTVNAHSSDATHGGTDGDKYRPTSGAAKKQKYVNMPLSETKINTIKQIDTKYQAGKIPMIKRCFCTLGLQNKDSSTQIQTKDQVAKAPMIKRCFCTLGLQSKGIEAKIEPNIIKENNKGTLVKNPYQAKQIIMKESSTHIRKKFLDRTDKLEPYECAPGVCIPSKCDPKKCLKLIQQRLKQGQDAVILKSVSTEATKAKRTIGLRTDRSTRLARSHNVPRMPAELEQSIMDFPKRKAMTIGSNISFNIEFFKESSSDVFPESVSARETYEPRQERVIHRDYASSHSLPKKTISRNTDTQKLKSTSKGFYKRMKSIISERKPKSNRESLSIRLSRCLCIGAKSKSKGINVESEPPKVEKNKSTMVNNPYGLTLIHKHQDTLTHKLEPYECAPGICIPGECKPEKCLKLIEQRLKLSDVKSRSIGIRTDRAARLARNKHIPEMPLELEKSILKPPKRTTIGSRMSFNIEFFKEDSTDQDDSYTEKEHNYKEPSFSKNSHKRVRRSSVSYRSIKTGPKPQTANVGVAAAIERCFCTLNLIKKDKTLFSRTSRKMSSRMSWLNKKKRDIQTEYGNSKSKNDHGDGPRRRRSSFSLDDTDAETKSTKKDKHHKEKKDLQMASATTKQSKKNKKPTASGDDDEYTDNISIKSKKKKQKSNDKAKDGSDDNVKDNKECKAESCCKCEKKKPEIKKTEKKKSGNKKPKKKKPKSKKRDEDEDEDDEDEDSSEDDEDDDKPTKNKKKKKKGKAKGKKEKGSKGKNKKLSDDDEETQSIKGKKKKKKEKIVVEKPVKKPKERECNPSKKTCCPGCIGVDNIPIQPVVIEKRKVRSKSTKVNYDTLSVKSAIIHHDKSTSTKGKRILKSFYECQPDVCKPKKCDPQVCFANLKSRKSKYFPVKSIQSIRSKLKSSRDKKVGHISPSPSLTTVDDAEDKQSHKSFIKKCKCLVKFMQDKKALTPKPSTAELKTESAHKDPKLPTMATIMAYSKKQFKDNLSQMKLELNADSKVNKKNQNRGRKISDVSEVTAISQDPERIDSNIEEPDIKTKFNQAQEGLSMKIKSHSNKNEVSPSKNVTDSQNKTDTQNKTEEQVAPVQPETKMTTQVEDEALKKPLFEMVVDANTRQVKNTDDIFRKIGTGKKETKTMKQGRLAMETAQKGPVIDFIINRDNNNILNCADLVLDQDVNEKRVCRGLKAKVIPKKKIKAKHLREHPQGCGCCDCQTGGTKRKVSAPPPPPPVKKPPRDLSKQKEKAAAVAKTAAKATAVAAGRLKDAVGAQALAMRKCFETKPCVCGSSICAKETKKLKMLKSLEKRPAKEASCICGSEDCEAAWLRTPRMKKLRDRPKVRGKMVKKKQIEKQEARLKTKQRQYKDAEKERARRMKLYAAEDDILRRKRKLEEKRAMEQIEKYKNVPTCVLLAESAIDVAALGVSAVSSLVKCSVRAATHPSDVVHGVREFRRDPGRALHSAVEGFKDGRVVATAKRIKRRFGAMESIQIIRNTMETHPFLNYLVHSRDEDPSKKYRKRMDRPETDFNCSLYMGSLRKRPCLWIYYLCPWFYPHCVGLLGVWRQFTDIILFILAIGIWSPCILAVEMCRALLCCFMCSG